MGKRLARAAATFLVGLVCVLVGNALRIGQPLPSRGAPLSDPVDENRVAQHLAGALRLATVSHENPSDDDPAVHTQLVEYLRVSWPRVHATLTRENVRGGLLYTWKGSEPALPAVLFAAHMDVVPPSAGAPGHEPFSGDLSGGYLWGRGALDDKGSLVCILEAAEALIEKGFQPQRTLYLAFGGDEEVGGLDASAMAALLQSRGVRLDWALDEGMMVTEGIVREVAAPVAPIGVGEKGYLSIELASTAEGGHASMPPRDTAVSLLAAAVDRLMAAPFPSRLDGAARQQMAALAPFMPFGRRIALANLWLFSSLVMRMAADRPALAAGLHTTLAPTIFSAGDKDNVLPPSARAVVNTRILPGETQASVLAHVRQAIADPRISVKPIERGAHDPPQLSPVDAHGYRVIVAAIGSAFPNAVIVPALVLGATDGRHYRPLANGVYRFAPFVLHEEDLARLHGIDERVKISDLTVAVRAYIELMRRAAQK
jgi:carboxypeptidase PM20D1